MAPTAGAHQISRQTIEQTHPHSGGEILGMLPAVHIVQHGTEGKGHQILLRGFDAAHGSDVEGKLHGVPLNEPSHVHGQGYLDFTGIIPETIAEVEINKGPFLPDQGDFATAGTVRFELGVPESLRPGFIVLDATHRGRARAVSVSAPADHEETTFAAAEIVYDRGFGPRREARRGGVTASYSRTLRRGVGLDALVLGHAARFQLPGALGLSDVKDGERHFYDAAFDRGSGRSDRALGRLGVRVTRDETELELFGYGGAGQFSLTNNYTGYLIYPIEGDAKTQSQESTFAGATGTLSHALDLPFPAHLVFGAGWRFDGVHQKETQVTTDGTPWQTIREDDIAMQRAHTYVGLGLTPFMWWRIEPSVRFALIQIDATDRFRDRDGGTLLRAILPRLTMTFPVHEVVTLFTAAGRGYRSPEGRAVTASGDPNEDVTLSRYTGGEPELAIADSVEWGAHVTPLDQIDMTLIGFGTWLDHEIIFDHVSNLNLAVDRTRRIGMEAELTARPLSWMTLGAAFTHVQAKFLHSGHPIPGAPRRFATATLHLGRERGPFGGARLLWMGIRPLAHGAQTDGYVQVDADAGWRFSRVDVVLAVDNVFNADIMEGAYHFASWFDQTRARSEIPEIHFTAAPPVTARLVVTLRL